MPDVLVMAQAASVVGKWVKSAWEQVFALAEGEAEAEVSDMLAVVLL